MALFSPLLNKTVYDFPLAPNSLNWHSQLSQLTPICIFFSLSPPLLLFISSILQHHRTCLGFANTHCFAVPLYTPFPSLAITSQHFTSSPVFMPSQFISSHSALLLLFRGLTHGHVFNFLLDQKLLESKDHVTQLTDWQKWCAPKIFVVSKNKWYPSFCVFQNFGRYLGYEVCGRKEWTR